MAKLKKIFGIARQLGEGAAARVIWYVGDDKPMVENAQRAVRFAERREAEAVAAKVPGGYVVRFYPAPRECC